MSHSRHLGKLTHLPDGGDHTEKKPQVLKKQNRCKRNAENSAQQRCIQLQGHIKTCEQAYFRPFVQRCFLILTAPFEKRQHSSITIWNWSNCSEWTRLAQLPPSLVTLRKRIPKRGLSDRGGKFLFHSVQRLRNDEGKKTRADVQGNQECYATARKKKNPQTY